MIARIHPFWMFPIAGLALFLGSLDAFAAFDLISRRKTVFYPELWLDSSTGTVLLTILVTAVALLAVWVLQRILRHGHGWWNALAVAMTFLALPIAFVAILPHTASSSYEKDSARLGGHVYRLMVVIGAVGMGGYYLYECDGLGLLCQEYRLPKNIGADSDDRAELIANPATETLTIKVNGQTAASFSVRRPGTRPTPTPPAVVTPGKIRPGGQHQP
jgi:hypothetical protein